VTLRELLEESDVIATHGSLDRKSSGSRTTRGACATVNLLRPRAGRRRREYLDAAFDAGAAGAVVAHGVRSLHRPLVEVAERGSALAECANRWYGHRRARCVIGVTGTNGRPRRPGCSNRSSARRAGAGAIGTTGVRVDGEQRLRVHDAQAPNSTGCCARCWTAASRRLRSR
jgi:UDP-N-acetylmuramyl tripeptide synthase